MGELRQPPHAVEPIARLAQPPRQPGGIEPDRVEPFTRAALGGGEQARPERAGGMAELATGMAEPGAERARQPLGQFVEPLLLRREQGLARGEAAQADVELLGRALGGALGAARGPQRRVSRSMREQLGAHRHRDLGGGGRRRRAHVGGEIAQAWCRSRGRPRR